MRLLNKMLDEYPVKYKKTNNYSRIDSLKDSGYLALFFLAGFIGGCLLVICIVLMVNY